jgi:asparagine synthetase B (glutamine-hydrolysing)
MDVSDHGMQPFMIKTNTHTIYRMCNGEIYNHKLLIEKYNLQDTLTSHSDCEVI